MRSWLETCRAIMVDGARVLAAHWPQFVGLALLGQIGRQGFIWLAIVASDVHPTLGILVVPLAPLSNLLSLVLMLRVSAESLPAFRDTYQGETTGQRWRHHLRIASGVLLPFILVYSWVGLLGADIRAYVDTINLQDFRMSFTPDSDRLNYAPGSTIVLLILGALVVRKALALTGALQRYVWAALLGTYLEALWMMTLANRFALSVAEIGNWLRWRVAVDSVITWWQDAMAWLGPLARFVRSFINVMAGLTDGLVWFLVLPLAWLAIAGATYEANVVLREHVPVLSAAWRRVERTSRGVQRVVAEMVDPVATPVRNLWNMFARLAQSGFGPLVAFCYCFLGLLAAQAGIAWLLRYLAGPRDDWLDHMIRPYVLFGTNIFFFVGVAALLPAALNLLASGQRVYTGHSGK